MKNRMLSLFLALVMALTLLAGIQLGTAQVASAYANDSGVAASGITSGNVKWTLYRDQTLYLYPDQSGAKRTLAAGDDVWAGRIQYMISNSYGTYENGKEIIEQLVIADGIVSIADELFMGYPALKTVTLPGMETIGKKAFYQCPLLNRVTVNGSIDTIGDNAFEGCKRLETFAVSGVVGQVGAYAFQSDYENEGNSQYGLRTFSAQSLNGVGRCAFGDCVYLTSVPPIRGSVDDLAFYGAGLTQNNRPVLVSGHSGTLGNRSFSAGVCYTGTNEEFRACYTDDGGNAVACQSLGNGITWSLNDGALVISGSGRTIDLLSADEQPWVNRPGAGSASAQRDAIQSVMFNGSVTCGAHVLDGLESKILTPFRVNITDGTCYGKISGYSATFYAGEQVKITANSIANKSFKEWEGLEGLTLIDGGRTSNPTSFTMPAHDVTIKAKFLPLYTIKVNGGKVNWRSEFQAVEGKIFIVKADTAPDGMQFKEWSGADDLVFANGNKTSYTAQIYMPAHDVTLTAVYVDKSATLYYTVSLYANDGTNASSVTEIVRGSRFDMPSAPFTRKHYQLTGWNTAANGSGSSVSCGQTLNPSGDLKYYAQWEFAPEETLTLTEDAQITIDRDLGIISGLHPATDAAELLQQFTNDPAQISISTGSGTVSTGSVIRLKDGNLVLDELTAVLYGDANGDGWYDEEDAAFVMLAASGTVAQSSLSVAQHMACDVNHDGEITDEDADILANAASMLEDFDRNASQEALQEDEAYQAYCDAIDQTVEITVPDPPVVSGEPEEEQKTALELILDFIRDVLTFVSDRFHALVTDLLKLI
ncbi:MAG: leucine-rich repeat protein [Clostridia bacterium]|nr:leucine-rich repeat protein [Clostridia bacterium]